MMHASSYTRSGTAIASRWPVLFGRVGLVAAVAALGGCAAVGSVMSPYPEKFSCRNSDYGQCIDPEQAYNDAVAGRRSRSDPSVTRDKKLLREAARAPTVVAVPASSTAPQSAAGARGRVVTVAATEPYAGYRDSLYREMQGLIEAPVTPMLRPPRTVRTLILPYAERQRPDRLYMPRFVYSVMGGPVWVVGDYLVDPVSRAAQAPVLAQVRETSLAEER